MFERLARAAEQHVDQQAALDKMRAELELADCTFRPQVNKASSSRAASAERSRPVHERLAEEAARQREQQAAREEERRLRELEGATFAPVLPARSLALGATGTAESPGGIFERLAAEAERLREQQAAREELRLREEMQGATFAPALPQRSQVLCRRPSLRSSSSADSPAPVSVSVTSAVAKSPAPATRPKLTEPRVREGLLWSLRSR